MGYPTNKPEYPVVSFEPTMKETLTALRTGDYATIIAATAVSMPFGYRVGKNITFGIHLERVEVGTMRARFCTNKSIFTLENHRTSSSYEANNVLRRISWFHGGLFHCMREFICTISGL